MDKKTEALKMALEAMEKTTYTFLDTEGSHGLQEQETIEQVYKAITALRAALEEQPAAPAIPASWVSVAQQMPTHGKAVLVCYTTHHSNKQVIVVGHYFERFREESRTDEDNYEYREEDDSYYIVEGWYEQQRNWDDYASIYIHEGVVTHWAPLPETPLECINENA